MILSSSPKNILIASRLMENPDVQGQGDPAFENQFPRFCSIRLNESCTYNFKMLSPPNNKKKRKDEALDISTAVKSGENFFQMASIINEADGKNMIQYKALT